MRFGSWQPIPESAPTDLALPAGPGVFQVRLASGLLSFPCGKSAMVAYGAGPDMGATLRELLAGKVGMRARLLGPLWVRFGAVDPHDTPALAVDRLRRRFIEQFGGPPAAEDAQA